MKKNTAEAKTLALCAKLVNTLSRDKAYVALRAVPLTSGAVRYLADCEVNRADRTFHFHLDCGKPTTQRELQENFLNALGEFVSRADRDDIAGKYFCDHVDDQMGGCTYAFRDALDYGEAVASALEDMLVCAKLALGAGDGRKRDHRPLLERVAEAARHYAYCVDDEMEFGRYEAPDAVPIDYDGEDYFKEYDEVVARAVSARRSLEEVLDETHVPTY